MSTKNSFHTIRENKIPVKKENLSKYFTIKGREDFLEDGQPQVKESVDDRICAKIENNKKYILRNSAGEFMDPIDPYDTPNPTAMRNGNPLWSWVEVEESTFSLYLRFLRTLNHTWLRQAQRG